MRSVYLGTIATNDVKLFELRNFLFYDFFGCSVHLLMFKITHYRITTMETLICSFEDTFDEYPFE